MTQTMVRQQSCKKLIWLKILLLQFLVVASSSSSSSSSCDVIQMHQLNTFNAKTSKRPVLLRGAGLHWPARQKWSLKYLRQQLQSLTFPQSSFNTIITNPDDYIFSKIDSSTGLLIVSDDCPVESTFKPLDDIGTLTVQQQHTEHKFLLIGANGSGLSWHNHQQDAFNCVVQGRKLWYFYPPNINTLAIDPKGYPDWWTNNTYQSRKEFVEFVSPRLKQRPLECTQESGDILFVPKLWFHMVINIGDPVVAVSAIQSSKLYL